MQETDMQETGLQETGLQETDMQETGMQETGMQETGIQETDNTKFGVLLDSFSNHQRKIEYSLKAGPFIDSSVDPQWLRLNTTRESLCGANETNNSERRRMEDSKLWRAVGHIETSQSQVIEVAGFFVVHHFVISRLWKQFQTSHSVVLLLVSSLPRVRSSAENGYIAVVVKRNRRLTFTRVTFMDAAIISKTISVTTVRQKLHLNVFSSIVRDFLELFYNLWRTVLAKNKIVLDPALRLQSFRTPENATIGVRGGVECQQQERWRPSSRLF
ncbi:transposable element Tcb2 transposase [Trichonephila clavipes]|nr:transposable element Tcb2 transposase [Trichonephila clavipes]